MKFGIIKEGKVPPDERVPLSPRQCRLIKEKYPDIELVVETSDIRAFRDKEYLDEGIPVVSDLTDCDVLLGVKEVPLDQLIANKTYLFFSHTYKLQSYNRDLLRTILEKKIRLIDYEMLKASSGKRLIGFGRYAGIVGAYNTFRAYGELSGKYSLKPAHECHDRREIESELAKVILPIDLKICLSGAGKVAMGALEILSTLKITQVFPDEFIAQDFNETIFTQIDVQHYNRKKDGAAFSRSEFRKDPSQYESRFLDYAKKADIFIAAHFWSDKNPFVLTREDCKHPDFNIQLLGDISCDIDGPVAPTLRPSTIADPFYGYNAQLESEVKFGSEGSIGVVAVDNLPCELPRDASEDFGNEFIKSVLDHFFNGDTETVLDRASETTLEGKLNEGYTYLQGYVDGLE